MFHQNSGRRVFTLVFALVLLMMTDVGVFSQALGPQGLRSPGRRLPEPEARWQWAWQWEALSAYSFPGPEGDDGPFGVALDQGCNLYVADSQNHQVVKVSPDGEVLSRWPTPRGEPGESSSPRGIAVDSQGNVYVSDYPRNEVLKLSPTGQLIATWGACAPTAANNSCDPSFPGVFSGPEGIAIDGSGTVYVIETTGDRIQKLTADGEPIAVWSMAGRAPGDLWILGQPAIDLQGNLYVPDEYNNRVLKLSPNGDLLGLIGGGPDPSTAPGQFHGPRGVAVDQVGNLYVTDRDNWRLQKLASDGSFIDEWPPCDDPPACSNVFTGTAPGQFFVARGVAVDGQGNVYVADTGNKRVERLIATPVPIPPTTP